MPVIEQRTTTTAMSSSRLADVRELERLWEVSPRTPGERPRARRLQLARPSGRLVAWGWLAYLVLVSVLEPAPEPDAQVPLWGDLLVGGFFLALVGAGAAAALGGRSGGFGFATVAGVLAMAVSVACTVTDHHAGSFWAYELAGAAVLTALSASRLRARRSGGAASRAASR